MGQAQRWRELQRALGLCPVFDREVRTDAHGTHSAFERSEAGQSLQKLGGIALRAVITHLEGQTDLVRSDRSLLDTHAALAWAMLIERLGRRIDRRRPRPATFAATAEWLTWGAEILRI